MKENNLFNLGNRILILFLFLVSYSIVSYANCDAHFKNNSESDVYISFKTLHGDVNFLESGLESSCAQNGPCLIPAHTDREFHFTHSDGRINGHINIYDEPGTVDYKKHRLYYSLTYGNTSHGSCPKYGDSYGVVESGASIEINQWPLPGNLVLLYLHNDNKQDAGAEILSINGVSLNLPESNESISLAPGGDAIIGYRAYSESPVTLNAHDQVPMCFAADPLSCDNQYTHFYYIDLSAYPRGSRVYCDITGVHHGGNMSRSNCSSYYPYQTEGLINQYITSDLYNSLDKVN